MSTKLPAPLTLGITLLLLASATASAQIPSKASASASVSSTAIHPAVQVNHVFIVMEENHGYSDVIGNPQMPYLNSLAKTYSVAQGYFANTHPSIGNYFMLTTGQIITNDDGYMGTVTADNVVRELLAAGKTWKEYSEAIPYQGYDGGNTGEYAERHNPLSYMSDVRGDPNQLQNLVPFTQLATDIANHALPNYGFIVPDLLHDAHDGSLAQADAWLQTNIAPLLASPDFNTPGGGLLIITFDEAETSDGAVWRWARCLGRGRPQRQPWIPAGRVAHSRHRVSTPEHVPVHAQTGWGHGFPRSRGHRTRHERIFVRELTG